MPARRSWRLRHRIPWGRRPGWGGLRPAGGSRYGARCHRTSGCSRSRPYDWNHRGWASPRLPSAGRRRSVVRRPNPHRREPPVPRPASARHRSRPAGTDSRLAAVVGASAVAAVGPRCAAPAVSLMSRVSGGLLGKAPVRGLAVPAVGPALRRGRTNADRSQTGDLYAIETTSSANFGHEPSSPRQRRRVG